MERTTRQLSFLIAVSVLILGCRSPRAPLDVRVIPAQKDVLHIHIELADSLEPLEYLADAEQRAEEVESLDARATPPLYEVHFSYYRDHELLAFVTYRADDGGRLLHERTLIQPAGSGAIQ